MKQFLSWCSRFHAGYVRFVEKQGFLVVLGVCVGVIVLTALWSQSQQVPPAAPTPPVDPSAAQAAQLMQEHLADALLPTPAPTAAPPTFAPPLSQVQVLQPFDAGRLRQQGHAGLWQLHDAVDLAAAPGDKVCAIAAGTVLAAEQDTALGMQLTVDHGSGVIAQYAGLAALAGLRPDDPVSAGQTLGFIGDAPPAESALGPHLHLRVTRKERAVDPTLLWR